MDGEHPCEVHREVVVSVEAGVVLREGLVVEVLLVGDLSAAVPLAVVDEATKSILQHYVSKLCWYLYQY